MYRDIEKVEFVIFDTETTGLATSEGERIVEIAGVRFLGGERIGSFHSLVNPGRPIQPAAFQVNKITGEMLQTAPAMNEIMPRFLEFIRGSCLCSYNAPFDFEFLNNELMLLGQDPLEDFAAIDVLRMARRLLPGLERYALWFVAEKLDFKLKQEHRALSDVEMTLHVFLKLKDILKARGIDKFMGILGPFGINCRHLTDLNNLKIAQIQQAIDLGLSLKISYLSGTSEISERQVIPKSIKRENGQAQCRSQFFWIRSNPQVRSTLTQAPPSQIRPR